MTWRATRTFRRRTVQLRPFSVWIALAVLPALATATGGVASAQHAAVGDPLQQAVGPSEAPPTTTLAEKGTPAGLMSEGEARESLQWLADRLIDHLPRPIQGDDDWGKTRRTWAGVKLRRDGWKWTTKRRWRDIRHGRWVRYQIQLPRPPVRQAAPAGVSPGQDPSPLRVTGARPVAMADGLNGWQIDASLATPAEFAIRIERWNWGVQWYSVQVTGTFQIRWDTTVNMAMAADYSEIPPALQMKLHVSKAELEITQLNVDRISKLGGDPAEELGDLAEDTLIRKWLAKENARLADRLNRAIQRHGDDLRWSARSWWEAAEWEAAEDPVTR